MRPVVTTVSIVAGVANAIANSQSLSGAGNLTLTASPVVLDAPRRVVIHSAGNDVGLTWIVTGTSRLEQGGGTLVETVAGTNNTDAVTTQDFATVTSIHGSGATASTVIVGTDGTASGPWVVWSSFTPDFQVSAAGVVNSGSPTWSVEYTYDNVFALLTTGAAPFPTAWAQSSLTGKTQSADGIATSPFVASRLTLTAYGSVTLTQQQQGT